MSSATAFPDVAQMRAKFAAATYVGDKCAGIVRKIEQLCAAVPRSSFLVALRNPIDVSNSWAARAAIRRITGRRVTDSISESGRLSRSTGVGTAMT